MYCYVQKRWEYGEEEITKVYDRKNPVGMAFIEAFNVMMDAPEGEDPFVSHVYIQELKEAIADGLENPRLEKDIEFVLKTAKECGIEEPHNIQLYCFY